MMNKELHLSNTRTSIFWQKTSVLSSRQFTKSKANGENIHAKFQVPQGLIFLPTFYTYLISTSYINCNMRMNNFQRKLEKNICGISLHIPPEKWKIKNKQERGEKEGIIENTHKN